MLGGADGFICIPPTLTGFDPEELFALDAALDNRRVPDEGDAMPELEDEDVEIGEDMKLRPSPSDGFFEEVIEAFLPSVAKNPPPDDKLPGKCLLGGAAGVVV